MRDQYDTLAWLYQQTSAMVTPLSKLDVLLGQYRRNLANWNDLTQRQLGEAFRALAMRLGVFLGLLAVVLLAANLWRRTVFRYVHDARRRSRFLLLRRIVIWFLIVAIVVFTFATEIGSLATFAGLITAGLAVAMQSVLVSLVGYFFLVGKYGVRVGDRVQIGNVVGEVVELGLVRLHLMELRGDGSHLTPDGPRGRVRQFGGVPGFRRRVQADTRHRSRVARSQRGAACLGGPHGGQAAAARYRERRAEGLRGGHPEADAGHAAIRGAWTAGRAAAGAAEILRVRVSRRWCAIRSRCRMRRRSTSGSRANCWP